MRVHHIGYAVKNIDKGIKAFTDIGYEKISEIIDDSERRVKIVFMKKQSECIELIAPNGENNAVERILKKNGPSPYHICYEVENIEQTVLELKNNGYIMFTQPQAAPAMDRQRVVFLIHKDIGIIELVEHSKVVHELSTIRTEDI